MERQSKMRFILPILLLIAVTGLLLARAHLSSGKNAKLMMAVLSDAMVERVLRQLADRAERPTEAEWKVLRQVCGARGRRRMCSRIFEYIREVLVPIEFVHKPQRPEVWRGWHGAGLPKAGVIPEAFSDLHVTEQFGDDSCLLGGNFAVVSDGITKDPDSDFFALMVVEYLRVVLPRMSGADPGEELHRVVEELEDLIVRLRLPGAATLSIVFKPDNQSDLYVATLGDSEVKVFRGGKVKYQSPIQRTGNKPGQLNHRRPHAVEKMIIEKVRVKPDDVIVLASDGLWDNVHEREIISVINRRGEEPGDLVKNIMGRAVLGKESDNKECSYSHELDLDRCVGARRDDISVLLLII